MVHHLFFDLDRTLWDFDTNSKIALSILFEQTKNEHKLTNFYQFSYVYRQVNIDLWRKYGKGLISKDELRTTRFQLTFQQLGIENHELNDFFCTEYLRISPQQTNLLPNAIPTLSELKETGYSMHIITNGFKEVQSNKLINSGLLPFFDTIVSSEDVGTTKPHRQIFYHALKTANAEATQSVMIGDDLRVDVLGARNIGMKAIHFDPRHHFIRKKNDLRINDLNELPQVLKQLNN